MLFVRDLMTAAPETVLSDASAADAAEVMRRLKVRHVPVVDDDGGLVGIVSDRDLLRTTHGPGRSHAGDDDDHPLDAVPVQAVMTMVVRSVTSATPAAEAGRSLADARISCFPVVDEGALVGILTEADFVRTLCRILEDEAATDED